MCAKCHCGIRSITLGKIRSKVPKPTICTQLIIRVNYCIGHLALTLRLADEANAFCELFSCLWCLGNVGDEGKSKLILGINCQRHSRVWVQETGAHDVSQPFKKTSLILCHDFIISYSGWGFCNVCSPLNLPADISAVNQRSCDQAHSAYDVWRLVGGS